MGGEIAIWADLFLRLFAEALAWCLAAAVVIAAGWSIRQAANPDRSSERRRASPKARGLVRPRPYVAGEPFGE